MTWWLWVLLWAVLVLGAAAVLVRLGLAVWRASVALLGEVGRAGEVSAALSEQVARLRAEEPPREPVVTTAFDDPVAMRRARTQRLAQRTRARRRHASRGRRRLL